MSLSANPKTCVGSVSLLLALHVPDTLNFNPFGCCFCSSQILFLHSCSISIYIFSSPGLCSGNSHYLGLLSALSSQFRATLGFCLCFPHCTMTWKFSRQWWGLPHFFFFGPQGYHCLIFSVLKTYFTYFMVIFKCFRWEGKYESSYNILPAIRNLHLERAYIKHFQTSHVMKASTF